MTPIHSPTPNKKCRKDYFLPIFAILSNNNNQEHSDHHDEGDEVSDQTVKSVYPDTTRRLPPAMTITPGVSSLPPATTVQPELPPAVLNLHNNCDESEQESRVESADVSNYCSFSPETSEMQISSESYRIPPEAYDAVSKVCQHPFYHPPRSIPGQVHKLANPLLHSTMKGKWPFMLCLLKEPCSNTWAIFFSLLCLLPHVSAWHANESTTSSIPDRNMSDSESSASLPYIVAVALLLLLAALCALLIIVRAYRSYYVRQADNRAEAGPVNVVVDTGQPHRRPEPDPPLHHIKYSIPESDSTNSHILDHDVVPLPSISRLPGAYVGIGYCSCTSDGTAESVDKGKLSELVITRKTDIKLNPLLPNGFIDEDVRMDCLSGRSDHTDPSLRVAGDGSTGAVYQSPDLSLLSKGELCVAYSKVKFSHRSDGDGCFSAIVMPDDLDDVESDKEPIGHVSQEHVPIPIEVSPEGQYVPSDFVTLKPPSSCNAQQGSLVITSSTWCINIVPDSDTYSALTPPTLGTADPAASAAPPTQLGANITHYQGGVLSYSCVMDQDIPVGSYELLPPTVHPSLSPVTPFVSEESHSMSCTSEGERYPSEMDRADIKPFLNLYGDGE